MRWREVRGMVALVGVILLIPLGVALSTYLQSQKETLTAHVITGAGAIQEHAAEIQVNATTALIMAQGRIRQLEARVCK